MARRGSGEGSIYQRKDGQWVACVNLGWEGGKRRRKVFYGKTRREVADRLVAAQRAAQQGEPLAADRRKLGIFLEQWLAETVAYSVRPSTAISYGMNVRRHIIPVLGHIRLERLTARDVQVFMNRKLDEGLSPRTVAYLHAILRRALGEAERHQLIPRNVAKLVSPPRSQRPEVRPLGPEQARALLDAARGDDLYALLAVAVALGLRRGEALGLRWTDVDLDEGVVHVRQTLISLRGKLTFSEPKTSRSRRAVPMPETCAAALREHRVRQLQSRLSAGERWVDHDLVFPSSIGTPMEPRNMLRRFNALCAAAGVPSIRFHDLRHTCASLLLAQGVHMRTIMEVLGHSQIAITANTYAHVMPEVQRDAARLMDAVLTAK